MQVKTRNKTYFKAIYFFHFFFLFSSFSIWASPLVSSDSLGCEIESVIFECQGISANRAAAEIWHQENINILKSTCPARDSGNLIISSIFGIDRLNDFSCSPCQVNGYYEVIDTVGGMNTIEVRRATFTVVDNSPPIFTDSKHDTIECYFNDAIFGWREGVQNFSSVQDCNLFHSISFTNSELVERSSKSVTYRYGIAIDDFRGNIGRESILLTVLDTTPPAITCNPDDLEIECNGQQNNQTAASEWNEANLTKLKNCSREYCSDVFVTSNFDADEMNNNCELVVTYSITDEFNNVSTRTATLMIMDSTPPLINCNLGGTTLLNCTQQFPIKPQLVELHNQNLLLLEDCSSDDCGNFEITHDFDTTLFRDDCLSGLVDFSINYFVTDNCGNIASTTKRYNIVYLDMLDELCTNLNIQGANNQLVISPLAAPITIAKVYNQQYELVYECNINSICPETVTIPNLTEGGTYFTDIQFFSEDFTFLCQDKQTVIIEGDNEPCDTSVCQGDVILQTQAEVDAFCGCTIIEGDLTIGIRGGGNLADINSLSNLSNLRRVNGNINISNTTIESITGFSNLRYVNGTLAFAGNPNLSTLNEFKSIEFIGGQLVSSGNLELLDMSALSTLKRLNGVLILSNSGINDISFLRNLENQELKGIDITGCHNLLNFDGLDGIQTITTSVTIGGNDNLMNLEGIRNITLVEGHFIVAANTSLSDCCSFVHLIDESPDNGIANGVIDVRNNANLCGSIEEILTNCQTPPPTCENIQIFTENNQIVIEGLTAPNEFVKVFDKDFNIVYQCVANCEETQMAGTFPAGNYTVDLQLYDENWALICAEQRAVTIESGNGNLCNGINCETIAPVLANIPPDMTVECDAIPRLPLNITATDNCDEDVTIEFNEEKRNGSCEDNYTLTRYWTAFDDCGNSTSRRQMITILDSTAPILANIPGDITAECDGIPTLIENVTATDNCDSDVEITLTEERMDDNCSSNYQLIRIWTATDNCGNTATAQQAIVVGDFTAPVLTNLPPDLTFNAIDGFDTTFPIGVDNCDPNPTLTVVDAVNSAETEIVRTFTTTDNCGNYATAQQIITIIQDGNNLCDALEITTTNGEISFKNIDAPNSIVKVFDANYQIIFDCTASCENELVVPVEGEGIYHTDVQFYDENWGFICRDRQDIDVMKSIENCYQRVCVGNIAFENQMDIDTFCGCEIITGTLRIGPTTFSNNKDILSIEKLRGIRQVKGLLIQNTLLKDLVPLSQLEVERDLTVRENAYLENLDGLINLQNLNGTINISDNELLENIDALNVKEKLNNVVIRRNEMLQSIKGLSNLKIANNVYIGYNTNLSSLDGLSNLDSILGNQEFFLNLFGLHIYANDNLKDIEAIDNLKYIGANLGLSFNPLLQDCCSLKKLVDNNPKNGLVLGNLIVNDNGNFCNSTEEILQNCQNPTEPICTKINIQTTNNNITIFNLIAPIGILKVFDANYATIYECFAECEETITLTDLPAGTYHININLYDENWNPICDRIEMVQIEANALDRNTQLLPADFAVYPNPAEAETFIDLGKLKGESVQLILYNQFGQKVSQQDLEKIGEKKVNIDLSTISNGLYILQITSKGRRNVAKKLIVNKLY